MVWTLGKAYSQDLRERVFTLSDEGSAVGHIAKRLRVSVSYVSKVLGRRRTTGEITARPQRCHVPLKLAGLHSAIAAEIAATGHHDCRTAPLAIRDARGHGRKRCSDDIWRVVSVP